MILDTKREGRQLVGIDKWVNNKGVGILDWCTGVGKSHGGKLAIERVERVMKDTYILLVPSETLKIQWNKHLTLWFTKELQSRIRVFTAQEIDNSDLRYECGTLIIDEIQEFHTDNRLPILTRLKIFWKRVLGLTGSTTDKNFFKITRIIPVIDIISEEEARRDGYISDYVEYNLAVQLTSSEQEDYDRISNIVDTLFPIFKKDIKLVEKCLNGGKDNFGEKFSHVHWSTAVAKFHGWHRNLDFNKIEDREIDDKYNPNVIVGQARRMMNAVRKRKQLLYTASNKYTTTIKILKKVSKCKTMVFSESNEFADRLHIMCQDAKIKSVVFHSSLPTKLVPGKTGKLIKYGKLRQKRDALNALRTGTSQALLSTAALDRGLDIPDIRVGVTASGTSNSTKYTQRKGRAIRKEEGDYVGDTMVLLVNIYVPNTVEEGWIRSRQKEVKHQIISISSVDEIEYIPPANKEFEN
jgi:superfamily II DNA or RNA helicase